MSNSYNDLYENPYVAQFGSHKKDFLTQYISKDQQHNYIGQGTGKILGMILQNPALGQKIGQFTGDLLSNLQKDEERKYQERTTREAKEAYAKRQEEYKKRTGEAESPDEYIQRLKKKLAKPLPASMNQLGTVRIPPPSFIE